MATNSILKNIRIKDKRLARGFIAALERARIKKAKDVDIPHKIQRLDKQQIRSVFGDE